MLPAVALLVADVTRMERTRPTAFALIANFPAIVVATLTAVAIGSMVRFRSPAGPTRDQRPFIAAATVVVLALGWVGVPRAQVLHGVSEHAVEGNVLGLSTANLGPGPLSRHQPLSAIGGDGARAWAEDVAGAIGRENPDVVVLVELTPERVEALADAGMEVDFPHHALAPARGTSGSGIYSTIPLASSDRGTEPSAQIAVTLACDGPVVVQAVHTRQPLAELDSMREQMASLADVAVTATGPVILAGDFNTTPFNRSFSELLDAGWHDAHLDRGRGLARTFPTDGATVPLVLIDHVLGTADVGFDAVGEFSVPGSDHLGVSARVAVPTQCPNH